MSQEQISTSFPYQSKYIEVLHAKMHYIDEGAGQPIVFLHGVPTSCYVWRNVISHLTSLGRCIAPDLIGFGKSEKKDTACGIQEHSNYLAAFIKNLNLTNVIFILHDWGSIVGLDYAMRHQAQCRGLVLYESYLRAVNGDDLSLPYQELLQDIKLHSDIKTAQQAAGLVERIFSRSLMRSLSKEEMEYYQEPFLEENGHKTLQKYIHTLPYPNNTTNRIIEKYSAALIQTKMPKLLLYSVPGFITTMATLMWAKENLSNLQINEVGEALHYAQEMNPDLFGESISVWLQSLEQ